jgi:hypothetical protein
MILLLIAGVVLAFVVWTGWGKPVLTRGQWRVGTGVLAVVLVGGGALVAARGAYGEGLGLAAVGGGLAYMTRSRRGPKPEPRLPTRAMSEAEARALLGLGEHASTQDVQSAHTRLMKVAHPDRGGTSGLAAQLNAARDRLLKR